MKEGVIQLHRAAETPVSHMTIKIACPKYPESKDRVRKSSFIPCASMLAFSGSLLNGVNICLEIILSIRNKHLQKPNINQNEPDSVPLCPLNIHHQGY